GTFASVSFPELITSGLGWTVIYDDANKRIRLEVISCTNFTALSSTYCKNNMPFTIQSLPYPFVGTTTYSFYKDNVSTVTGFMVNIDKTVTISPQNLDAGSNYKVALLLENAMGACYYEQSFIINPQPEANSASISQCEDL